MRAVYFSGLLSATATALDPGLPCPSPRPATPSYPVHGPSAHIPFLNKVNMGLGASVAVTIATACDGGQIHDTNATVDTGSEGLMASLETLGLTEASLDDSEPGNITYTSDNLTYIGYWIQADVSFPTTNVLSNIRILAVTEMQQGEKKTPTPNVTTYMGVGFGRVDGGCPTRNPFINVLQINGTDVSDTIRQGYILSNSGVELGLTKHNTRKFNITTLDSMPNPSYCPSQFNIWQGVNMNLSINSSSYYSGHALLDTGITQSILMLPSAIMNNANRGDCSSFAANTSGWCLPNGTEVKAVIGNTGDPITTYDVVIGTGNPMQAEYYIPYRNDTIGSASINTGRYVFNGYDAMFDSDCGYFGLKNKQTSNETTRMGQSDEL